MNKSHSSNNINQLIRASFRCLNQHHNLTIKVCMINKNIKRVYLKAQIIQICWPLPSQSATSSSPIAWIITIMNQAHRQLLTTSKTRNRESTRLISHISSLATSIKNNLMTLTITTVGRNLDRQLAVQPGKAMNSIRITSNRQFTLKISARTTIVRILASTIRRQTFHIFPTIHCNNRNSLVQTPMTYCSHIQQKHPTSSKFQMNIHNKARNTKKQNLPSKPPSSNQRRKPHPSGRPQLSTYQVQTPHHPQPQPP